MTTYQAPLRDIRFAMDHLVDLGALAELPAFKHADPATVYSLLSEFGRFVGEVLAPYDRIGDTTGITLDPSTHEVTTPPALRDAYRLYVESGWPSVPFAPDHGGGGFPWLVALAMQEMVTSANMAFSLCPLLTQGAIDMLANHGSEDQQSVVSAQDGERRMDRHHEPDRARSRLRRRRRADPGRPGARRDVAHHRPRSSSPSASTTWPTTSSTWCWPGYPTPPPGPEASPASSCPSTWSVRTGPSGARNDVRCVSIEHKLGIHASPTCVMSYGDDGAVGYLDRRGQSRACATCSP